MADDAVKLEPVESSVLNLSNSFAQSLGISCQQTETETEGDAARRLLASWLGVTFKVCITDGRVIVGNFVCTDREGNLILENSWEHSPWDNVDSEPKQLSLAMIPGKHLKSVFIPANLT